MPDLSELVRVAVEAAGEGEAVEAYAEETRQTEASALRGEVEGLQFAESRGLGVRLIRDGRLGYAYAADPSPDEVRGAVAGARENAALTEPETYPHWLVGADSIRDVDDTWPKPGSRFHHVVGVGPIKIPDHTEVLAIEPGRLLRLKVKARPFVSAEATFTVVGDGERCVVSLQEEPTVRWAGNLVRPVMDPSIHVRNQHSLERLAALVEHRS